MKLLLYAVVLLFSPMGCAQQFYPFTIDQDHLAGAPDAGSLNHPLAAGDKLKVCAEHFCRVSDGTRVRLFGVNLSFGNNFPPEADAPRIAKRLRRFGINIVRLTHTDTKPNSNPSSASCLLTTGPYPTLNLLSIARLRAFLDALKAEGIYVDLNLHVGYTFRAAADQVPPVPQSAYQSKPLNIFYPRMVDLQCEYARKVIEALKLRDDPVLGVVEINNEVSLIWAWQVNRLDPNLTGEYRGALDAQWNAFLKARYATTGKLREAWGEIHEGESLESANISLVGDDASSRRRLDDYLLFLTGADRAYLKKMLAAIRAAAGPLVPVAGTQVRYGGLGNFDSHLDVDFQDNHYYVDHYNYPHTPLDPRDWRQSNSSGIATGLTMLGSMCLQSEAGRPYTMSEVNQPWPNMQGNEIDVVTAAVGAFQDWDAVMHYGYDWQKSVPGGFNLNAESSKQALLGQAAFLFRSGAIQAGKTPVAVPLSSDLRLRATREKLNMNIVPLLTAETGLDPANVFVHPVKLVLDGSGRVTQTDKPTAPYQSDTGELTYDREGKLYLIHAPQAAGILGVLGNRPVSAGPLEVQLAAGDRGYATILLTSLDGRPLTDSQHLLLSTPGYMTRTRAGSNPAAPQRIVKYPGKPGWWTLEPDPGSE